MGSIINNVVLPAKLFRACAMVQMGNMDFSVVLAVIGGTFAVFAIAMLVGALVSPKRGLAMSAQFGVFATKMNAVGMGAPVVAALFPSLLPHMYMIGAVPAAGSPMPGS